MVIIEKAFEKDAQLLIILAREIYAAHYLHLWHPGGAEWYMYEYAYADDNILQELTDSNVEYYIAFENGEPMGYLKLVLTAVLTGFENTDALELERIYLHRQAMGKGIGKQFMLLTMQRAKELKKEMIFLKAMDSSIEAIDFYKKAGYTICGSLQLPMPAFRLMKAGYRGMVILKQEVDFCN